MKKNLMSVLTPSFTSRLSRLKLFWALSRTPHGLIDMTTPGMAACLCLGSFPSMGVLLLGVLTVFAGYTAVYALNDLVDYRVDRERLGQEAFEQRSASQDLDAALIRHPMAQDLLTFKEGLTWALSWAAVAILGAYILNPVCAFLFLSGCALEAIYCLLFKVSPFRTIVNGIVKTLGAVAAVFAVNPAPDFSFLLTLFFTFFLWEVGGQNIPNDCGDIEEDRQLNARTVPVSYGIDFSAYTSLFTLAGAFLLTPVLFSLSPAGFGTPFYLLILGAGTWFLMLPALDFYRNQQPQQAMILFNKASYYPLVLFVLVFIRLVA